VDAGSEPNDLAARLWLCAGQVLLVTSPEAAAVMDSYALVKTLLKRPSLSGPGALCGPLALVVNRAADEAQAADVCRRIDQSCRRFLGLPVPLAGWLPHGGSESVAAATSGIAEFVAGAHRAGPGLRRAAA
jgi:flagellar biosynthesis protein FlhG